jgi:hypothetical protein
VTFSKAFKKLDDETDSFSQEYPLNSNVYRHVINPESMPEVSSTLISKLDSTDYLDSQTGYISPKPEVISNTNHILKIQSKETDRKIDLVRSSTSVKTSERDHEIDVSLFLVNF